MTEASYLRQVLTGPQVQIHQLGQLLARQAAHVTGGATGQRGQPFPGRLVGRDETIDVQGGSPLWLGQVWVGQVWVGQLWVGQLSCPLLRKRHGRG